jgi:hypothetical protein
MHHHAIYDLVRRGPAHQHHFLRRAAEEMIGGPAFRQHIEECVRRGDAPPIFSYAPELESCCNASSKIV